MAVSPSARGTSSALSRSSSSRSRSRGGDSLATALAGASASAVALTTLVFPFVPPGFPLPWGSFAAPLLAEGLVAPNLLHLVWRPLAVVVPFALVLGAAVAATGRRRLVPFLLGAVRLDGRGPRPPSPRASLAAARRPARLRRGGLLHEGRGARALDAAGGAGSAPAPGTAGAGRDASPRSLAFLTRQTRNRGTRRPSRVR